MKKLKGLEYFLFIITVFFQNFALINTKDFGIASSVCFLLFFSIFHFNKFYRKFNKKFLMFLILFSIFLFISSFVNNLSTITQILKLLMVIWLVYVSNVYIKEIFKNSESKFYFCNIYATTLILLLIYGLYEVIAERYSLPLFLNIFSNNSSYGEHTLYDYFHGWINTSRLYSVFFEPSVFSVFLVFNFFFIKEIIEISRFKKRILYFLILFNLFFTYSRTGYITFIYILVVYILFEKLKVKNKFAIFLILMLPFITLYLMYFVGLYLYDDKSSLMRTYSGIYYLQESITSFKYMIFGHGCGSIVSATIAEKYVANCANNGYVDIIYQYGIVILLLFCKYLNNVVKLVNNKKYLILGILGTFCCFASYYCVETIVILIVIVFNYIVSNNQLES